MFLYSTVSTLKPVKRKLSTMRQRECDHQLKGKYTLFQAQRVTKKNRRHCYEAKQSAPMVGMVVTISPNFSLYRMVVLPAASSPTCTYKLHMRPHPACKKEYKNCFRNMPTMRMRISFLEKRRANNFVKANPILKQPFLQPRYSRYANTPGFLGAHCRAVCLDCAL
jgi:hypothetical protein